MKYSSDYLADEQVARTGHVGIWRLLCETPWDFRAKRWEVNSLKAPDGCPIKGNVSSHGRIYHMPWDHYYPVTKIDTDKGERWFCDENESLKAGWRKAR